jgi:hypothetical protein
MELQSWLTMNRRRLRRIISFGRRWRNGPDTARLVTIRHGVAVLAFGYLSPYKHFLAKPYWIKDPVGPIGR